MASTLPTTKSGLYADPKADGWHCIGKKSSIPRARSSIRIIIWGIAAASVI
jgi:hypothetical protein